MDLTRSIQRPQDLYGIVAAVHAAAFGRQLPPAACLQLTSAAMEGGLRALEADGGAVIFKAGENALEVLVQIGEATPDLLLATPVPSVERRSMNETNATEGSLDAIRELAAAMKAAADAGDALEKSRSMVSSLERELTETNHGVMALYAELDDRAEKLRKADELKSRFLSYASHELRTPLNGIVGLVRLLMSSPVARPEEDRKQLTYIQRAAEDMREMVNDLLDLAKVEAGKITVEPSEFDLAFVFGALRGIFRPFLQTEDISLVFEDTSAVPAIYSDEGKVSQILRNFLSNALKFTEQGTIRVWAVTQGDYVIISVSDTGIGIAPDQLSKIFEEFSQVDSPLQRRVRGTGLGLPLCKKLAALLGGRVTVESTVGKGSVFTLVLPRTFQVSRNHDTAPAERLPRTRATLLIVDDKEIDRYLLSHLITAKGDYDIIQAEDGQAGLDAARREQPDLIFLDLNLPRMNGFLVAAELRADPVTRGIPVFVITAEKLSEADEEKLRALTEGIILKEHLSDAQHVHIHLTGPVRVSLA